MEILKQVHFDMIRSIPPLFVHVAKLERSKAIKLILSVEVTRFFIKK